MGTLGGRGIDQLLEGIRSVGLSGVYGWADRECRYSGARKGIGGIRGHWELFRGVGVVGPLGGVRGMSAVEGVSGVHWGWQGV